jgi:hypothetical protein
LIGQTTNVRQPARLGKGSDTFQRAATANKKEEQVAMSLQRFSAFQQGVQRIAGAVVSCIHDNELARQIILLPECFPALFIVVNTIIQRRGDHFDLSGIDAFSGDAVLHKSIEGDDCGRAVQTAL